MLLITTLETFYQREKKMLSSIDKYKKYLSDKKVQKQIEKAQKKIEKHQLSIEAKRERAIQKSKDDIMSKYEKQQARFLSRANRELEKQIRKAIGRKPLKKKERSMKQKALAEFQKYCKLARCNVKTGLLTLVDTGEVVKWNDKKVNAWHYYPKHNYPHLAFDLDNCRPISRMTNKLQGDNVGLRRRPQLALAMGSMNINRLDDRAKGKKAENVIYDNNFYNTMYSQLKELNRVRLIKLFDNWII